jgi:hypothetical protein
MLCCYTPFAPLKRTTCLSHDPTPRFSPNMAQLKHTWSFVGCAVDQGVDSRKASSFKLPPRCHHGKDWFSCQGCASQNLQTWHVRCSTHLLLTTPPVSAEQGYPTRRHQARIQSMMKRHVAALMHATSAMCSPLNFDPHHQSTNNACGGRCTI